MLQVHLLVPTFDVRSWGVSFLFSFMHRQSAVERFEFNVLDFAVFGFVPDNHPAKLSDARKIPVVVNLGFNDGVHFGRVAVEGFILGF